MKIKIYGTDKCSKCKKLKSRVEDVVEENDLKADIEKVNDSVKAAKKNILNLPALEVDGEVKLKGKLPTKEEIEIHLDV